MGRGLLAASLLAIGLVLLAVWQAMPTGPILLFCGVFGLLIGGVLAFYRKPTRLAAAIEADRQLRFDDLLVTAIYPSARADADFRAMINRMADARCSAHSPSEVLLRRFGIRRWGGIAFAMSIAVTLAVIPFEPSRSQAVDANASVLSASPTDLAASSQIDRGMIAVVNDPLSQGASSGAMTTETTAVNDSQTAQTNGTAGHGITAGAGGGKASTASKPGRDTARGETSGRSPTPNGIAGGGGAASNHQGERGDSSPGSVGTSTRSTASVPGWSGATPTASPAMGTATDNRIPPEDRDLVRDFFKR